MVDFKMKYQIVADAAKAKAEVREFDDILKGVGTKLGGTATGAVAAGAAIAAVGTAAVGAGVALFNLSKEAAAYGSEIYNASVKTGLSAETMSALKLAADRTGVSLESVGTIINRFSKTIGEAAQGSEEAKEKLVRLGIDPANAAKDLDGALAQAIKQISAMETPVARATAAQQLFGKAGTELLKVIDDTKGDLPGLIAEAKRLGLTLSNEDARAADEFGDQLDILQAQFRGIKFTIGKEFMPVFNDMAKGVSDWLVQNKDEIARWGRQVADTLGGLIGFWNDYHNASAGEGAGKGPYTTNAMGEKVYASDFLGIFGTGALGLALQNRGAQARADRAFNSRYVLDPVTNTLVERSSIATGGKSPDDAFLKNLGGPKKAGSSGDNRTDKQAYQDFVRELRKLGVPINSGFRTYAQQAALYNSLPRGQAARPGTSDHEFYRAVDLPTGVTQEILEKAARAAGVILEKRFVHQGTGLHNHQAFRKGRSTGGGESAIFSEVDAERRDAEEFIREQEAALKEMAADMIAAEQNASGERLAIRQKEADVALKIIEGMVRSGEMSEIEAIQRVGQLRVDMLENEREELAAQITTAENRHRLEEIRLELDAQRLENLADEENYWKRINDEIQRTNNALEKRNQRPGTLKTRQQPGQGDGFLDQLYNATGQIQSMDDVLHQLGQTATDVFMQMSQGLAASITAWIMLGDQSDVSAKKMIASLLASVAQQAFTLAIFHTAMGIAALTPWGAAMYGSPANHFMAAAIWAGIGAGTALGARALSGGGKGAGATGSGRGYGGGGGAQRDTTPISRVTDDAYISGRRTDPATLALAKAVEKLEKKIGSMKSGEVLVAGMKQKPGVIGNQAAEDVKRNASIGVKLGRSMGMR